MNKFEKLILIAAPSGSGKTTIVKKLLSYFNQLAFSVSATTRQARDNETNGIDYHFMTEEIFRQHIQSGNFIEWEMVYQGKYYGTMKTELNKIWQQNKVPLLEIDVKGALRIMAMKEYKDICLSIFIAPPSLKELETRLYKRNTDSQGVINDRLNKASYEMDFKDQFKNIVINDDLDICFNNIKNLIQDYLNQ